MTENQAALKASESTIIRSKVVTECLCAPSVEHAAQLPWSLVWIPGHQEIKKNERADLPKRASQECLEETEPICVVSLSVCIARNLRTTRRKEHGLHCYVFTDLGQKLQKH